MVVSLIAPFTWVLQVSTRVSGVPSVRGMLIPINLLPISPSTSTFPGVPITSSKACSMMTLANSTSSALLAMSTQS